MNILLPLILLTFSHAEEPAAARMRAVPGPSPVAPVADLRSISDSELKSLAEKLAMKLKLCKELKHGAMVDVLFKNKTAESIDPSIGSQVIQEILKAGTATGPGKTYELRTELLSTSKQTGTHYEGSYTYNAQLYQAQEKLCEKSEKFDKVGDLKK